MKRAALLLAAISFLGISCERHSWEETKGLHQHGGGEHSAKEGGHGHGAESHGGAGDTHKKPAEEGKDNHGH